MTETNNTRKPTFRPRKDKDENSIRLGISQGDINGIGYEVMLKCFSDSRMLEGCTPVLYGSSKVASYHKKLINANDFPFVNVRSVEQVEPHKFNILNIIQEEVKIDIGQATEIGGKLAALSLDYACHDLMSGKLDAIVTNPINKKNIQSESFNFPGHTEYLTKKITENIGLIGHFHVANSPLRCEPPNGEIDYPAVFDAIAATDYDGYIGFEYRPSEKGKNFSLGEWIAKYKNERN